jgi:two-component sensor histidine kinase
MEPEEIETFELSLQPDDAAPELARRWLQSLPIDSPPHLLLLTHELVMNALVHTTTERLWITLLLCPDVFRVQVANEGAGRPRLISPQPYAESGRGLRWVDALSRSWGFDCTDATHVWFQVKRDGAGRSELGTASRAS